MEGNKQLATLASQRGVCMLDMSHARYVGSWITAMVQVFA